MSPEAQRIAIAKACGWTYIERCRNDAYLTPDSAGVELRGHPPGYGYFKLVPDYLNDLNAMHEAEKLLSDAKGGDYDMHLWLIIKRDGSRPAGWHATAAQRAEAFLRTLGLWKEGA